MDGYAYLYSSTPLYGMEPGLQECFEDRQRIASGRNGPVEIDVASLCVQAQALLV